MRLRDEVDGRRSGACHLIVWVSRPAHGDDRAGAERDADHEGDRAAGDERDAQPPHGDGVCPTTLPLR